jgi:hypothetical protein
LVASSLFRWLLKRVKRTRLRRLSRISTSRRSREKIGPLAGAVLVRATPPARNGADGELRHERHGRRRRSWTSSSGANAGAFRDLGRVSALADPDETGGPYPPDDPDQPWTKAWTHRHRGEGRTNYELFDQVWLSPDLAPKQMGAFIQRRTTRSGEATDHDPAWVELRL